MYHNTKQSFFTKSVPGNPDAVQVMCMYGNGNQHEVCLVDTNGAGDWAYSEWVAKIIIDALTEESDSELGERLTIESIS